MCCSHVVQCGSAYCEAPIFFNTHAAADKLAGSSSYYANQLGALEACLTCSSYLWACMRAWRCLCRPCRTLDSLKLHIIPSCVWLSLEDLLFAIVLHIRYKVMAHKSSIDHRKTGNVLQHQSRVIVMMDAPLFKCQNVLRQFFCRCNVYLRFILMLLLCLRLVCEICGGFWGSILSLKKRLLIKL